MEVRIIEHGLCGWIAPFENGNNSIWVIVDRLTKTTRFIPTKVTWKAKQLTDAYVKGVLSLRGIPKTIVSDRDTKFMARFWNDL